MTTKGAKILNPRVISSDESQKEVLREMMRPPDVVAALDEQKPRPADDYERVGETVKRDTLILAGQFARWLETGERWRE